MSLEEKIGQLFIVPACPLMEDERHFQDLKKLIKEYHIGGVLMKTATPSKQKILLQKLKALGEDIPLLVTQDAEWGLGMRMPEEISFPRNLTLGAIQDENLLIALGEEIGKECKKTGGHINFAPVVDVNSNPNNPVIGMRSFGEDPKEVAERALLWMKGMKKTGVFNCAKHFPGHGDTTTDSHFELPTISSSCEKFEEALFPFRRMIEEGVECIIVAHLLIPSLSQEISSLSPEIVTDLLQKKLGFRGLIITDALNMEALKQRYSAAEIAVKAFEAGEDFLLYGDIPEKTDPILEQEIPEAFSALKKAFEEGKLNIEELNRRVTKILKAKESLGLFSSQEEMGEVDKKAAKALKKQLFEQATTLAQDKKGLLPLKKEKILYITIGKREKEDFFYKGIQTKTNVSVLSHKFFQEIRSCLNDFDLVILSAFPKRIAKEYFDFSSEELLLLQALKEHPKVVCLLFGTPYSLPLFEDFSSLLVAYEEDKESQKAALKILFGEIPSQGKLPISWIPKH